MVSAVAYLYLIFAPGEDQEISHYFLKHVAFMQQKLIWLSGTMLHLCNAFGKKDMKKNVRFPVQLHNNIAKFRLLGGWSQTALAEKVGIDRVSLFRIEHRRVIPSVITALLIAKYLEVSINELFTFEKIKILTEEEKFELEIKEIVEKSRSGIT